MDADARAAIDRYDRALVARLRDVIGDRLVAAYATGSHALGDYVHCASDLDRLAVSESPLGRETKEALVDVLREDALPCPARGLELVVYAREAVERPTPGGAFELNLNTGPGMPLHFAFDPADEPSHWFLVDRAIAREHGIPLAGPPPAGLLAPIPRPWVLRALADSLAWHRANAEVAGENTVLNACRAWLFAAEGRWSSKRDAAAWARTRVPVPAVVDAAVAVRFGRGSVRP